jgi:predicted nucleic acid-binding Zn ribbon protein
MNCPVCGNEALEGSHFCIHCGAALQAQPEAVEPAPEQAAAPESQPAEVEPVPEQAAIPTPESIELEPAEAEPAEPAAFCVSCGRPLPADAVACAYCKTAVGVVGAEKKRPSRRRSGCLWAVGGAGFLGLVMLLYLLALWVTGSLDLQLLASFFA